MKNKHLLISLFVLMILISLYNEIIYPYIEERNMKLEIKEDLKLRWNIDIDLGRKDNIVTFKKNKPGWHGEQQKFISLEIDKSSNLYSYIKYNTSKKNKMPYEVQERIKSIEDNLNVKWADRVKFYSKSYQGKLIYYKRALSSESKNDLLYIFLIKEEDKLKIFFIEDINVPDIERYGI